MKAETSPIHVFILSTRHLTDSLPCSKSVLELKIILYMELRQGGHSQETVLEAALDLHVALNDHCSLKDTWFWIVVSM